MSVNYYGKLIGIDSKSGMKIFKSILQDGSQRIVSVKSNGDIHKLITKSRINEPDCTGHVTKIVNFSENSEAYITSLNSTNGRKLSKEFNFVELCKDGVIKSYRIVAESKARLLNLFGKQNEPKITKKVTISEGDYFDSEKRAISFDSKNFLFVTNKDKSPWKVSDNVSIKHTASDVFSKEGGVFVEHIPYNHSISVEDATVLAERLQRDLDKFNL